MKGRELLLKAVSILTNFNSMLNVVPMALAQLHEPSELVSFTERLLRAGAKRKVSIVVGGKVRMACLEMIKALKMCKDNNALKVV